MNDEANFPETKEEIKAPLLLSVEETIEQCIGQINRVQIVQTILASLPTFFDTQQTFISVFTNAIPPWHCTVTSSTSCRSNKSNLCDLPKTDWAWNSGNATHTSIISEWGLECAPSFIAGLPTTCFFIGCLFGGCVMPTLGDSYLGRKNLLCLCSLIMCLAAFASAFSPNMWVYSFLRLLSGFGRAPIAVCGMVLLTERVGKKSRGLAVMIVYFALSLGVLELTSVAYLTRDFSWRTLYLCTSIPGIICTILCYFFMYESPRWLFTQGRTNEAIIVLSGLGRSTISRITQTKSPNVDVFTPQNNNNNNNNSSPLASLKVLFSRTWALKRLLALIFPAFGIGLVYFGLLLGVENLGYNIYLTTTLDALLSLSTSLITFLWWIQHCDRKSSLLGFCTVGGIMCVILSIIDKSNEDLLIVVQLVSLFCTCMACNILVMYLVELFPTCVRNSSSSVVRLALILASIFVPTLNLLGRDSLIYSNGIPGLVMLLSGFLVIYLPETRGKALCDTMEEQEFIDFRDRNSC